MRWIEVLWNFEYFRILNVIFIPSCLQQQLVIVGFFLDYNCIYIKINSLAFIGLPYNLFLIQETFESEKETH